MEILYLTLFFIFGSIMGSFFYVIAVRVTKGESILKPRSHCEKCGHILKWYELIPIISFLIQGGKCRNCKTKLNIGYIFMEICTGVLFAVCYHVFDLSLNLLAALIFVSSLIITIISDIEYMVILDEVLITAILGIIVVYLFNIGIRETAIKVLSATGSFITMLAIKKVLADTDKMPVLIFDEIDTGISGKAAGAVAEKLNGISKNHQVLCISHLPSIAAIADYNYFISKRVINERTNTNIKLLNEKETLEEIARISSGEINEATIQYAMQLRNKKVS